MAKPSRVATSVYLEDEQHTRLLAASRRTGVPMAVFIRRGIDRELDDAERDKESIPAR